MITREDLDAALQDHASIAKGNLDDALQSHARTTKDYLDGALRRHARTTKEYIDAVLRENTREIVRHFNESQGQQNERFDRIEARLTGVGDRLDGIESRLGATEGTLHNFIATVATRDDLRNLITELGRHGMMIEETRVFTR